MYMNANGEHETELFSSILWNSWNELCEIASFCSIQIFNDYVTSEWIVSMAKWPHWYIQ